MSKDQNIEIARLQKEAAERLGLPADRLIFDFSTADGEVQLDLVTINPRHDQSFLFHSLTGKDKLGALKAMLDYIRKQRQEKRSYTVQWTKREQGELHTSYFRARNMLEVLEKFSHGRDLSDYTIYSITLNPIT